MKIIAIALALLTAACIRLPQPVAGYDPADPDAPARPIHYRSTLGAYESARPVDPAPWRERNERVAPKQKP